MRRGLKDVKDETELEMSGSIVMIQKAWVLNTSFIRLLRERETKHSFSPLSLPQTHCSQNAQNTVYVKQPAYSTGDPLLLQLPVTCFSNACNIPYCRHPPPKRCDVLRGLRRRDKSFVGVSGSPTDLHTIILCW
jgi:hypothetical protein